MTTRHLVGKAGGRFGRASLAALLSVAVAGAYTPVAAFGAAATATESTPYYSNGEYHQVAQSYDSATGEYSYPDGAWIEADSDPDTYEFISVVDSDHSHYAQYGLKVTFTVKNGVLTGVDASGVPLTYSGVWGSKLGNHNSTAVIGYLPDGVAKKATSGKENIEIALTGAENYAAPTDLYISKADLWQVNADGTATNVGPSETTTNRGQTTTTTGYASTALGVAVDDDNITWTPGDTFEKSGRDGTSTYAQNGTLTVKNADANMLSVEYKIGQDVTYTVFYALANNQAAVDAYEQANKTDLFSNPGAEGVGNTNRDDYTALALTMMTQRELVSWMKNMPLSKEADESELQDIDTVSGATKSSHVIQDAYYAAMGYKNVDGEFTENSAWKQLFTSVSDDLAVSVDGRSITGDTTSVTKNSAGQYEINHNLVSAEADNPGVDNGPSPAKVYLYSFDKQLSTAEIKELATATNSYAASGNTGTNAYAAQLVSSYDLETKQLEGAGEHDPEYLVTKDYGDITYTAETDTSGTWTVTNDKVNYFVIYRKFAHGTVAVAYDLAGVCEATRINTEVAVGVTASSAAKLKSAYNALTTDAKGFVTASTLATLNTYQSITVKKATATVKASAVKKKAKTLSFTVSGAKTALKVGSLTKAQKKGISKVKVSGNKVKVTVKKGAKKGTYKLKVAAKAANGYKASSKQTITVKVK